MKKFILTSLILCVFVGLGFAQPAAVKVITNGNVGFNNDTPNARIHVTSAGQDNIIVAETTNAVGRIFVDSPGNTGFNFAIGGAKKWTPAAFQGGGGAAFEFTFWNEQSGSGSLVIDGDNNNATFIGSVSANGLNDTSDKRYKKNIKSYVGGLKEVLQLEPVTFQYNNKMNAGMSQETYIGVVAQDFQKIVPSLVRETKREELNSKMEKTGRVDDVLSIQSNAVQYMLVNAVKEQQVMIEDLKAENEELRAAVNKALEAIAYSERTVELNHVTDVPLLKQNTPNPFKDQTSIEYFIPSQATSATLMISSMDGKVLRRVELTDTGKGVVNLRTNDFPTGNLYYSLIVDGEPFETKKMVIQQ